jgi:hypothetical protein
VNVPARPDPHLFRSVKQHGYIRANMLSLKPAFPESVIRGSVSATENNGLATHVISPASVA